MDDQAPQISVVIPIFNEVETLHELYRRLTETLEKLGKSYEILTVDDGSSDGSVELLRELRAEDPRLRVLCLSRNFGQSPALYAGFAHARGQYTVMLDADLQNYPEDIPKIVAKLEEGYDMVSGWRAQRQDSFFRNIMSRALNAYIARVTRVPLRDYGCALKGFRRDLVEHMSNFSHRCRYLPVDVAWLGGRVAEVEVRHDERKAGDSKYSLLKLIRTAFDLLTSITSAPLQFIGVAGWLFALVGFGMAIRVGFIRLLYGVQNNLETVVAIFFFLAGVQMVATGLMCEYVSRLYIEVQRKPYYVVREEVE
jgi:undecaprenyl-phosphate 4-deoxy-4-formamido-L-arabinose transferase